MTEQQASQEPAPETPPGASQQPTPPPPYQAPPPPPQGQASYRRLTRTSWDAPISGVCGGIARYFGVDPTLVRVVAVIGAIVTFPAGLIAYVVVWAVIPKEQ